MPLPELPTFHLELCRDLVIERPVVQVTEDDVTEAFRTLARSTPELGDPRDFNALARLLGFDDALALRREVRSQLQRQNEDAVAKILRLRVLNRLLERFEYEPDPSAVREEVASLVRDAEELGQQLTPHKVEQLVEPLARHRVKSAALVRSLARALHIEPADEQIVAALRRHAELYRDPEAVLAHLEQSAAAAKPVIDELVENMVVEGVLRHARVIEQPRSMDELAHELERAVAELDR